MKKLIITIAVLGAAADLAAQGGVEIRRNQVGCYPQQEKVIVVEGSNPAGKVQVTTPDGKKLKLKNNVRKAVSPMSGKTRYVVDLGELKDKGRYNVSVGKQQCDILVAERPYKDIAKASLRLFYLIRSGVSIQMGGEYNRPTGHADTQVIVHPSAASPLRPAGTIISSPFGWYDAGDYNKYVVNSAFSIGLMFAAYEQQQTYFTRLKTNIPESGNNTPDFLDEMMFNLKWLMTMQDPYDGGVYHKLTTPNFEGFVMPKDCRQQRYVVKKTVTATLDFAAVMADAARLFEPYQRDYAGFSATAAAMAERAYQWATEHPAVFYHQEQLKDPAVTTGAYDDTSASDEFFWAASALYRLTGKKQYMDDARKHQPQKFTTPSWGGVATLGAFEWMASDGSPLRDSMLQQLTDYCEETVKSTATSSFQSPYGNKAGDFGWGCLSEHCCCQALALLYADKMLGTAKYRRYALQNADYLMGRNATGYCFVTGFGDKSPMYPHHRISGADGVEAPFPGMLVGGPNPGQQDKNDMPTAYISNIPDESYMDVMQSYASNEIAINWNASLVAFLCWLDALNNELQ
jgi:endoglucanase